MKRHIVVLIALGFVWCMTQQVRGYGQDVAFKVLDLVIERSGFEKICDFLEFSEEQKKEAGQFFDSYNNAVQTLDAEAKQRADAAGFARVVKLEKEAYYKGVDPPREEIDELMVQSHAEYVKAYKVSDALILQLYEQLQLILLPSQEERFERIPRLVRRLNLQRRRRGAVRHNFMGVYLFPLVEEASAEDGELEPIFVTHPEIEQEQKLEDFRNEIQATLLRYELEFDSLILEGLAGHRRKLRSTTSEEDRAAAEKRAEQEITQGWSRFYRLTDRAVIEIAAIVERAVGGDAKEAWIERFYANFCPDLYSERWPERTTEWLLQRQDFTVEQLELSEILLDEYLGERRRLRQTAVAAGVRARRTYLSAGGMEPLQFKYEQRLFALQKLIERTISRFRSLLNPEQRVALANEIKHVKLHRRHLLGPHVNSPALEKITNVHVPEGVLILYNPETGERIPNKMKKETDDDGQNQNEDRE